MELRNAGLVFTARRVTTEESFRKEIETFHPDLILADYSLPTFDGLSALKVAREKDASIPFIFVSGTIGEDFAIETMKMGATDYVLKDRLFRLAPVVVRALKEAEEKRDRLRAEEMLREKDRTFRMLIEKSSDMVVILESTGIFKYISPSVENILGYKITDLLEEDAFSRVHPEDIPKVVRSFSEAISAPGTTHYITDFRYRHANGSWITLESIGKAVYDKAKG